MHAVIGGFKPDAPQTDDVQAVQVLYGTAAVGPPPAANFTYSPTTPTLGVPVLFTATSTGAVSGSAWNFGDPGSVDNIAALPNAAHFFTQPQTYSVTLTAGNLNGSNSITRQVTVSPSASTCATAPETLCLSDDRFKVSVVWQKSDATQGFGTGVSLTSDSGYFWFFDDTNIEAVVKVLNGCATNGHYWVFAAGLTDVSVTLYVLDTRSGTLQRYANPLGQAFQPIQDTSAFATCP